MKNKKAVELDEAKAFVSQPSITRLKAYLGARNAANQESYNKTIEDHRYKQGRLAESEDLLNLLIEATEKR